MRGRMHPLIDMLLDILSKHHSLYGDGVKRSLLMLHHFLKRLLMSETRPHFYSQPEAESKWRASLHAQLGLFRRHILPELLHRLTTEAASETASEEQPLLRSLPEVFTGQRGPLER